MSNESYLLSVVVLNDSRKQVLYSQKCERQVDQTNGLNKWIKRLNTISMIVEKWSRMKALTARQAMTRIRSYYRCDNTQVR